MPTEKECKQILSKLGWEHGVSPRLISTRLLSDSDKQDMLRGEVPIEALDVAVMLWKQAGMPDYANGDTKPLKRDWDEGRHIINLAEIMR